MAGKSKSSRGNSHPALADQTNFKHKDLVRACIIRGMPFEDVLESSDHVKANWHYNNYFNQTDLSLLDKYDEWVDKRIKKEVPGWKKKKYLFDSSLKIGYVPDQETGEKTKKRISKIKVIKRKRERNATLNNIYSGTKKELTWRCAARGKNLEETRDIVMKEFPDANAKSIRIWWKKAEKEVKSNTTMQPHLIDEYSKLMLPGETEKKVKVKVVISKEYQRKKKRRDRRRNK